MAVAHTPTAVICEDDAASQRIALEALERCGFRVVAQVDTVMDAAQYARVFQPDVLVLDLLLPWVSGEYVISVIRHEAPQCAIVVCSAHATDAAIASGASFAVTKGSVASLEAVLKTVANGDGSLRA